MRFIHSYSKSYAHRFVIIAWLLKKDLTIKNFSKSEDASLTLNALYNNYKWDGDDLILNSKDIIVRKEIYIGESGSTLRFLIPLMLDGSEHIFKGKGRIFSRPLDEYRRIIEDENGLFDLKEDRLVVKGSLGKKSYEVSGIKSSQFISAMMMAGINRFDVVAKIGGSSQYIDITRDAIDMVSNNNIVVVPEDMSNFSLFAALERADKLEGSLPEVEARMQRDGIFLDYIDHLKPIYDLRENIDLAPMLVAYLSTVDGHFIIKGIENLAYKESNRLREIIRMLEIFEKEAKIEEDRIIINGSSARVNINKKIKIKVDDHRICHMAIFLAEALEIDIKIDGIESLKKSHEPLYQYVRTRYV